MRFLVLVLALSACTLAEEADHYFYGPVPTDRYLEVPLANQVSTTTPDGERIVGAFLPGVEGGVTIVYCHGRGEHLDYYWQKVEHLRRTGYGVAAFDYRGFGLSTGEPTEEGLRTDARAFLAYLKTRDEVDATQLVYYGNSLGGAVCIDLAATHPPLVLITESTFTSVDALVEDGAYADLPSGFFLRSRWDSLDKIAHIDAPYLALHGLDDTFVQPRYSEELAAAHPGRTNLILVPGAGHEDVPDRMDDQVPTSSSGSFVYTLSQFVEDQRR